MIATRPAIVCKHPFIKSACVFDGEREAGGSYSNKPTKCICCRSVRSGMHHLLSLSPSPSLIQNICSLLFFEPGRSFLSGSKHQNKPPPQQHVCLLGKLQMSDHAQTLASRHQKQLIHVMCCWARNWKTQRWRPSGAGGFMWLRLEMRGGCEEDTDPVRLSPLLHCDVAAARSHCFVWAAGGEREGGGAGGGLKSEQTPVFKHGERYDIVLIGN